MSDLAANGNEDYALKTIKDGKVPETRMANAASVVNFVRRMWENDTKRSYKRSRLYGLVAGRPPYLGSKLRDAGRAEACNVNWGTARAFMESGAGAYYDLTSEAPGFIGIQQSYGEDEKRDEYSRTMSEEADRILAEDKVWDYEMMKSQFEMVLYGHGPFIFEDSYSVLPVSVHDADLKVPERTRGDTEYWEICCVDRDYYPAELYKFIRNESAATEAGWDVEFTKKAIEYAMDIKQPDGQLYNWEFYAQELKANSFQTYGDETKICKLAHAFWMEFDGTITHAIVERESTGTTEPKYLFFHRGRFKSWKQAVHPMYMDRGNAGYHHTTDGLGIKMYSAMEWQNRLLSNLNDKSFAPKILFRPTSQEALQKFQLTHLGDYGTVPAGWDFIQNPIAGFLNDGIAMYHTSDELIRSNLSSYRQNVPVQESGNPPTKFQKQLEASQQSSLSKTCFNRYYKQLDLLYTEIVRRLCNFSSTDQRAKLFQERCEKRGVPRECFGRVETVEAIRVVGEGSAFLRKAALQELFPIAGSFNENGMKNFLTDFVAASAGQKSVSRYLPPQREKMGNDQMALAMLQVSGMRNGVAPILSPSQNGLTFAGVFLKACVDAIQSVQQGADPREVVKFISLAGPACIAHVRRILKDPFRREAAEQIFQQIKRVMQMEEKLKQHIQKQAEAQRDQQQKTGKTMNDAQIKQFKAANDARLKEAKLKHQMMLSTAQTKSQLALADATAASQIARESRLAAFRE